MPLLSLSLSLSLPVFFLLLFFIHPPLHLPLHSPSHFISLSFLSRFSLCLLKVSNKQTSSGWLASPIYNSSQSNYSKDVCQTHEVHLSIICVTIMAWTRYREYPSTELKDSNYFLWHFSFVLIENTPGKGRDDRIGRRNMIKFVSTSQSHCAFRVK